MRRTPRTHNPKSLVQALKTSREALKLVESNDCGPARKVAAQALQEARRAVGIPKHGVYNSGIATPHQELAWSAIKANVRVVKRECPVRRRR